MKLEVEVSVKIVETDGRTISHAHKEVLTKTDNPHLFVAEAEKTIDDAEKQVLSTLGVIYPPLGKP